MSLLKQLWIATAALMILVFIGSFLVSIYRAQDYFEEQLRLKNMDNANSLALILSHIEKEPALVERFISAQYDSGHYRRIELLEPEGEPVVQKLREDSQEAAGPEWFRRLLPLEVEPGVAHVQEGWMQYGVLFVESTSSFAQEALWQASRELFLLLLGVAVFCGILGSLIIKRLTRPLVEVVRQAEAIGERKFINSKVPKTLEFANVVKAMNKLSDRIRQTLESEGERLEELRKQTQTDKVTGLANRDQFIALLEHQLQHEDLQRKHGLLLLRVCELGKVNKILGYQATNQLLCAVADVLIQTANMNADKFTDIYLARLNGSDFAILLNDANGLDVLGADLCQRMQELAKKYAARLNLLLPLAAGYFKSGDDRTSTLMRLDTLMAVAEHREETCLEISTEQQPDIMFHNADEWRNALELSISEQGLSADQFPVLSMEGKLIHYEAKMRLSLAGQTRTAGSFIPWARRLGMLPKLDLDMLRLVLSDLLQEKEQGEIAVNLSMETWKEPGVRLSIIEELKKHPDQAKRLNFELSERSASNHLDLFHEFCAVVKPLGCKLGLERSGAGFANINRLQEIGLDYLKVDRSLVHGIYNNTNNQNFLRGLCILGHSIGLLLIAEGVESESEIKALRDLGMDGITGPGVGKAKEKS